MLPAQEDPLTLRNKALNSLETGKKLYENSETPSDKAKGYQLYKKGLELMMNYTKGKFWLTATFLSSILS